MKVCHLKKEQGLRTHRKQSVSQKSIWAGQDWHSDSLIGVDPPLLKHAYRRAEDLGLRQSAVWVCAEGGMHAGGVTTHNGTLYVCSCACARHRESRGSGFLQQPEARMLWCVWVNRALDDCCAAYSVSGEDMQKTPPQTLQQTLTST